MNSSEWEVVGRGELRDGDEVRVTYGGSWYGGALLDLETVYERKVVPSPAAEAAARAVVQEIKGIPALVGLEKAKHLARVIERAMRSVEDFG